jgi:hypothetical protein
MNKTQIIIVRTYASSSSYKQHVILILKFSLLKPFFFSFFTSLLSNHIYNLIATSCHYRRQFALKTNTFLSIMHKNALFFFFFLFFLSLTYWCMFAIYVYKYIQVYIYAHAPVKWHQNINSSLCTVCYQQWRQLKWIYFTHPNHAHLTFTLYIKKRSDS